MKPLNRTIASTVLIAGLSLAGAASAAPALPKAAGLGASPSQALAPIQAVDTDGGQARLIEVGRRGGRGFRRGGFRRGGFHRGHRHRGHRWHFRKRFHGYYGGHYYRGCYHYKRKWHYTGSHYWKRRYYVCRGWW